jgi:hypothetical protein
MKDFGPVMQHGYIVGDVEKTALEWAERVGVGPFYILERNVMEDYYYRGQRMTIELKLGFAYWGSVQVELIQQINDAPSFYRDAARTGLDGINHLACIVSGVDSILERRRLKDRVVQSGRMNTGVSFVYLETYAPGGLHLELIDAPAETLMAFAGMEAVSRSWDGSRPLRSMEAFGEDMMALKKAGG